ncbi:MAG TPA: ThiF family adenylyltransferase [Polyangia bacterium]|nr:ThiF family adenylyltransferase [Polyangia bacterium]
MSFSLDEIERYSRQILLPEWGAAGQERLRAARIEVAGAGLCAEMAVRYLGAAGVGALRVATEEQAALVRALNPHVAIEAGAAQLPTAADAAAAVQGEGFRIVTPATDANSHAAGAALALEALKALLGLPYRATAAVTVAEASPARGAGG